MHSTSRVTWLARTSGTLAGRLILRLRSTLLLRERKPLRAVQRRTGNDPASRLGRSLSTCRRATHRLVGLGRSPARTPPTSPTIRPLISDAGRPVRVIHSVLSPAKTLTVTKPPVISADTSAKAIPTITPASKPLITLGSVTEQYARSGTRW